MDAVDALRGADANPGGAVADQIADLQLQVAQLTQMLWSGVKMETVSGADRQSVKDALEGLDGGDIFNEAVAVQNQQAKQQQLAVQREVQQLRTRFMIMGNPGKQPVLCMCLLILGLYRKMRGNLFVF